MRRDESFHVLAVNERNVLTELLPVDFDQTPSMFRLFVPHALKDGGGCGIVLAQSLEKVGIDALVFLFERDGQSEYLSLR